MVHVRVLSYHVQLPNSDRSTSKEPDKPTSCLSVFLQNSGVYKTPTCPFTPNLSFPCYILLKIPWPYPHLLFAALRVVEVVPHALYECRGSNLRPVVYQRQNTPVASSHRKRPPVDVQFVA